MRTILTAIVVAAMSALTVASIVTLPFYSFATGDPALILYTAGLWALFFVGFWLLRRVPVKAAVILIVVGSVAIGGAALTGPPNTSTDSARYAWDGIVQDAGISPYKYVPTSPHLANLRPDWLFPAPTIAADGSARCEGSRIQTSHEPHTSTVVCTALNRGSYPTIYPPSSELLFAGIRIITGPDAQYWPMQVIGLLLSLGILVMLLFALRRRGLDPRWAALWGWCPLVATEAITNSHVDTLGALLLLAATLLVSSGKPWRGGLALGAAIAAKLIPVIGAPALLRRQPWKIVLASVGAFLVLYVPYLVASGPRVLGYLPRYLGEEGFDDGSRFALITPIAAGKAAIVVALVILLIVAVLVWRKTDPVNPWLGQVVMIGVTLLVVSPRYPWYALLLVPMIAMSGRWEWLVVPLALTARGLDPHVSVLRSAEVIALIVIIIVSIVRSGPGWHRRALRELAHPLSASAAKSP
ncbi:MAG TPA: glycosyltransferase 87 family protein [Galbitalea sp.]